jgi:hypothetical protein
MFIHLRHYWHKMAHCLEYGAVQWLDTPDKCLRDVSPTLKTLEQSIFVSTSVTVFIVKNWRSDNSDNRTDDMVVSGYTEKCYTTAIYRFCYNVNYNTNSLTEEFKVRKTNFFPLCQLVSRLKTDEKSRHDQLHFQMEIFGNERLLIEMHTPPVYISLSPYPFKLDNWINVRDRLFDWNLPHSTILLITGLYKEQISIHRATIQRCLRRTTLECKALYSGSRYKGSRERCCPHLQGNWSLLAW